MLKAELVVEVERLRKELTAERQDRKDFESRIVTIASEAAYEHELCEVLDHTLAKIGIEVPKVKIIAKQHTVYELPLTDVHRQGLADADPAERVRILRDLIQWGDIADAVVEGTDVAEVELVGV